MTHLDSQTKHSHGWKDTFQAPNFSGPSQQLLYTIHFHGQRPRQVATHSGAHQIPQEF